MTTKKKGYKIDLDQLIAIVFLLSLSSISLVLSIFFNFKVPHVNQILVLFGFVGLFSVFLLIILHYLSKANEWVRKKDWSIIVISLAIIFALVHSGFFGLSRNSWMVFGGYLAGDAVMIVLGLIGIIIYKKVNSKKVKKNKK